MSVQSDVKKALDALGADIAALQSQCASLASQVGSLSSGIDSSGTGWIRFSDGTQVCWADCGNDSSKFYVTFPKSFLDIPVISLGAVGPDGSKALAYVDSSTKVGATIIPGWSTWNKTIGVKYIAVGRWK